MKKALGIFCVVAGSLTFSLELLCLKILQLLDRLISVNTLNHKWYSNVIYYLCDPFVGIACFLPALTVILGFVLLFYKHMQTHG